MLHCSQGPRVCVISIISDIINFGIIKEGVGFKWYKKGINKLTNIKCVLLDHFHCQLKCAVHTFMENEKHSLITFLGTKKLDLF